RADTGSVWVVLNVPGHRFYEMNREMLLWEIVRSSTAAPIFFRPKFLPDVGEGEEAVFVDGAVSMHNNPALPLFYRNGKLHSPCEQGCHQEVQQPALACNAGNSIDERFM
ncbi:MAG: hypothetical protein B1H13_06925, partial [Desulfobacteraceae bacterium 4484_190.3]